MRKSEKLQATDEQLQQIETRRSVLGWSTGDDSEALIEAARVLIFGSSNGDLPAKITEERITRKELCDRAKYNKWKINEQIEKSELERSDIHQLIGDIILVPQGVSYRSWQNFRGQKEIDKRAFQAYWVALGLSLEDLGIITPEKIRANRIYHAILTLDHTEQVRRLDDIGGDNARVGKFLIDTQCQCSRAWLMWRLETAILSFDDDSTNQVQRYALNVLSTDNIQTIKDTIHQKVNRFSTGHYNLIITIDNIDCLDRSNFDFLLNSIEEWKMIIGESSNYFILYLIDRGKHNDWREDDQLYETIKLEVTQQLTLPQLTQGLRSIYRKLRSYLDQDNLGHNLDIDGLAEQFVTQTNNGQFRPVLEKIYPHFKCDLSGETRWFNYP